MYGSTAARMRRARRERRMKVIRVLSIVIGGIAGIVIGFGIVASTMPGHEVLKKLGL